MNETDFKQFLDTLDELRRRVGFALVVSSAYRCHAHNAHVGGSMRSRHLVGDAVDISVRGQQAFVLITAAIDMGFYGVGVAQKGDNRFIHIDRRKTPTIWSY